MRNGPSKEYKNSPDFIFFFDFQLKVLHFYLQKDVKKNPGDRWMIRGPRDYVPPVKVEVVTKRKAIPLDENEGIYVRDIKTGKVRAVCGETYMLTQDEELWEKTLPPAVETLINAGKDPLAERGTRMQQIPQQVTIQVDRRGQTIRDKTKVVTFRVPHNAAVQIYDYKEKKARYGRSPD